MSDFPDRHTDLAGSAGAGPVDAHAYTLDRFQPLVGDVFTLTDGTGKLQVTLVEASSLREVQGAGQRSRQFSLVWRGPPQARLAQRIYTVSHPQLGTMELFLVTIGPDDEGMRYEAVFT